MVSPVIEQLASELPGKVVFGKLNVDGKILLPQMPLGFKVFLQWPYSRTGRQ